YTIPKEDHFSTIEYKVLLNQRENNLLRCSKVTCNGHLQLVYNVQQLQSLSAVVPGLPTSKIYSILAEVLKIYQYVKENGFLNENHLQLDLDLMYITLEPLQLYMIYCPFTLEMDTKEELIDGWLYEFLISITKTYVDKNDSGGIELLKDLKSNAVSLETLTTRLEGRYFEEISEANRKREKETLTTKKLKLVQSNPQNKLIIPITKQEFVIGKKVGTVDGVIEGNPTVSRIHCKILVRKDVYMIVDLSSVNGTMVNGLRCSPNIPVRIKNGDQITISDLTFNFIEDK
ncbi:FHA domain-containing protein, partial [Anaerosporobacter sp.]